MLIFYVPAENPQLVKPIVILDYTRSDEQYSIVQIQSQVSALGILAAKGKLVAPITPNNIYSLDYSMSYTHSGTNYGNALKTSFSASIINAPIELVSMLKIEQYVSKLNIESLSGELITNIIDPQVQFPTGAFVIKPNANSYPFETISRTFMVYSAVFNFDARRTHGTLSMMGAGYDNMVMRLGFAANIKSTLPLVSQLTPILATAGFILEADPSLNATFPKIAKYYEPATVMKIMDQICLDNNLIYDMNTDRNLIKLKALTKSSASNIPQKNLCFNGLISGANVISEFSLQNYVSCIMETEAFDCELFDYVSVYDDTSTQGQFANLVKIIVPIVVRGKPIFGYKFYVQEYTFFDNRVKTSISIKGTNNWILSTFKLDNFLENKIYTGIS